MSLIHWRKSDVKHSQELSVVKYEIKLPRKHLVIGNEESMHICTGWQATVWSTYRLIVFINFLLCYYCFLL